MGYLVTRQAATLALPPDGQTLHACSHVYVVASALTLTRPQWAVARLDLCRQTVRLWGLH